MADNSPPQRSTADLPSDLVVWVRSHFSAEESDTALSLLIAAVIHTGETPDARLLRSAALGSAGSLERLRYYVGLLAVDWRDVVVAGEYAAVDHQLVRVRDLTLAIPPDNDGQESPG